MTATSIDWWTWRSKASIDHHQKALESIFQGEGVPGIRIVSRDKGLLGYDSSARIFVGDLDAGLMAWGGKAQNGWTLVSISGSGCSWVNDWDKAQDAAKFCKGYQLKRVDIALDVFDNSSNFDLTLQAYRSGGFTSSGRPPKCEPTKPERPEDSAIIRIGNRSSDKYLRCYEKGKEQLGPGIAASMRSDPENFDWGDWLTMSIGRLINGRMCAVNMWDWWRMELELKPQTSPLPKDLIDRRDHYFAGAYPYLGQMLSNVQSQSLSMTRERGPQLNLALALETIRRQYGPTLFTALTAHNGDIGAVWDRICGNKHSKRLLEAGVLMVDHDLV